MGHELYRMIRDGAPPSWTAPMRLVAGVIADDARDPAQGAPGDGGRPWSAIPVRGCYRENEWRDGITERTGMSEHTIRRALADLARAGYEMREQADTDWRGRPVFAYKGRALRFRVPPLKPRQSPPDMAGLTAQSPPDMAGLTRPKASQIRRKGEPNPSQRSADLADPVSPDPPKSPSLSRESDPRALLAGLGATEREIDDIITTIKNDPNVRSPAAYIRATLANGDGPELLDRARRALAAQDAAEWDAPPPRPPWCGQCDEQTRLIALESNDGKPMMKRCPRCHPLAGEGL
jgi:hypothetical protein